MAALKKLRAIYEEEVDRQFHGMAYNWKGPGGRRGKRSRLSRPDVNYSYVIREAIMNLLREKESEIEYRRKAQEDNRAYNRIQEQKLEEEIKASTVFEDKSLDELRHRVEERRRKASFDVGRHRDEARDQT